MSSSTLCVDLIYINILFGNSRTSSASMVEDQDKSKINPKNVVGIMYNDIHEEQHQAFEVKLKNWKLKPKGS